MKRVVFALAALALSLSSFAFAGSCEENSCPSQTTCVEEEGGYRCELKTFEGEGYKSMAIPTAEQQNIVVSFSKQQTMDMCNQATIVGNVAKVSDQGPLYLASLDIRTTRTLCRIPGSREVELTSKPFVLETGAQPFIEILVPASFKMTAKLPNRQ